MHGVELVLSHFPSMADGASALAGRRSAHLAETCRVSGSCCLEWSRVYFNIYTDLNILLVHVSNARKWPRSDLRTVSSAMTRVKDPVDENASFSMPQQKVVSEFDISDLESASLQSKLHWRAGVRELHECANDGR